jgi:acetyltransferase
VLVLTGEVRLADGRRALLRAARPTDAAAVQAFVRGLSPQTSRRRFLRAVRELAPAAVERIVTIDHTRSMTFVAASGGAVVGLAQYVAEGAAADIALVVADAWQRAGLGRALFAALVTHAERQGIARLHGDALADNAEILALTRRFGFSARTHPEERGLVRLTRELGGPWPIDGERLAAALWDLPVAA